MANISFDLRELNGGALLNNSTSFSMTAIPSSFQFDKIGRPPALLQRISTPSFEGLEDIDRSLSLSPDFEIKLLSEETSKIGQPSLQARLSMPESPNNEANSGLQMPLEVSVRSQERMIPRVFPPASSYMARQGHINEPPATPAVPVHLEKYQPPDHPPTTFVSTSKGPNRSFPNVASMSQKPTPTAPSTTFQPPMQQASSNSEAALLCPSVEVPLGSNTPSNTDHGVASLRAIQIRLSSGIANLKPVSTADALRVAQSTKDQCDELILSAKHAYEFAEQALVSARLSMDTARQCSIAAESIQKRTIEVLNAIECISSAQRPDNGREWNDTIQVLQDDSHQLEQWTCDQETQAANQREMEDEVVKMRNQVTTSQPHCGDSNVIGLGILHEPTIHLSTPIHDDSEILNSIVLDFQPEADTLSEKEAERRRHAEEELCKFRRAEAAIEEQKKADMEAHDAKLAQARAERIKAEEQETFRQEQEVKERESRRQELQRRQEAQALLISQRKANEEQKRKEMEEKERELRHHELQRRQEAEALFISQRKANEEQKRKEMEEKTRLDAEADKHRLLREQEKQRRQAVDQPSTDMEIDQLGPGSEQERKREQEKRRQEISDQKQRASAEDARKIKEKRAMEKHSTNEPQTQKSRTPTPIPSLRSASKSQSILPANNGKSDSRNIASNRTLIANTKKKALAGNNQPPFPFSNSASQPSSCVTMSNSVSATSHAIAIPPSLNGESCISQNPPSSLPPSSHHNCKPTMRTDATDLANVDVEDWQISKPAFQNHSQQEIGRMAPNSTVRRSMSLPTVASLPEPSDPSSSPGPQANFTPTDVAVDSQGPDIGNVPLLPRSQRPPISPEVQKANLRGLIGATGEPKLPIANINPDALVKSERSSRTPVSCISISSQDSNGTNTPMEIGLPRKTPKTEMQDDIPLLSLPVSPVSTFGLHKEIVAQHGTSQPRLPDSERHSNANADTSATLSQLLSAPSARPNMTTVSNSPILNTPSITLGIQDAPRAMRDRPSAPMPLPSCPLPTATITQPFIPEINSRISITPEFEKRLGPDNAIPDSWYQSSLVQMDMGDRGQRVRAPLPISKQYSPPPSQRPLPLSSDQRGPPLLSRVFGRNHYAPDRQSPDPMPPSNSHDSYSKKTSAPYQSSARAITPDVAYPRVRQNSRPPLSPEYVPHNGRKRARDEQDVGGSSSRRSRYDDQQQPREMSRYNNEPPSTNQYQEEWSHTAEYGRSPSPERFRATPLSQRIEPEIDNRLADPYARPRTRSPAQRVDYQHRQTDHGPGGTVGAAAVHRYDHQYRHSGQDTYVNSYPPRQFYRNPNNDLRPPLLQRFTDSTGRLAAASDDVGYSSTNRLARTRVPKPSSWGSAQPPLEHRIASKGSLINRLE